jgi:ferritin
MAGTDTKAGETGFADVTYDLVAVQYHALKAGHDYAQYVQDARDAGRDDIAEFIEKVAVEDANRAKQCHEFLKDLSGSPEAGEAVT